MDRKVKELGKRFYLVIPNMKVLTVLKSVQSCFQFFFSIIFFPPNCEQMYGKLKAQLHAFLHDHIPQIWLTQLFV